MAKNKDGLEAGGSVTWAEMTAANANRKASKPVKPKAKAPIVADVAIEADA